MKVEKASRVFYPGETQATIEHIYSPAVAEAVDGIDTLQSFGWKGFFEVFFTYAVDPVASDFLSPLVDKDPVLIWRLWGDAVFVDIELEKVTPSVLKKILAGKKVLVDSNIIIYLTDAVEPFARLSRLIFQMVKKGTGK